MLIWYLIEFLLSKVGKGILIPEGIWLTSESSERKIGKNETLWGFSFGQSKKAGQDVKGIVAEYSTWRTINKKESKGGRDSSENKFQVKNNDQQCRHRHADNIGKNLSCLCSKDSKCLSSWNSFFSLASLLFFCVVALATFCLLRLKY